MTTLLERRTVRNHQPQPTATRTPRILCVDDDPDLQTAIELRMRRYDVTIEHAYYGMQGIVEAANTMPDLILMDQAMPHGNGEYLLEVVKRNPTTCNIPVIVLTGMRDPALRHRLLRAGAEAFLQKPVLFEDLVHQISRFVDLRECEPDGSTA